MCGENNMNYLFVSFYNRFFEYETEYSLATLRLVSVVAKNKDNNIVIHPYNLDELESSKKELDQRLLQIEADVICLSAYVWTWSEIEGLLPFIKEKNKKAKILIGGPEVINHEIPLNDDVFYFYGEGERFFNIFNDCTDVKSITHEYIANIVNDIGEIRGNTYFLNCDQHLAIGLPLYSKELTKVIGDTYLSRNFAWYETSRGCAYNCSYCGHKTRKGVCVFDYDFVENEIKEIGKSNINRVFVVDPIIGGTPKNGKKVLELFNKYAPNAKLIIYIRPEYLDAEYIDILGKANLEDVRIGVQTVNDNISKEIRNNNIVKINKFLPELHKYNIPWRCELITGLPGDTVTEYKKTLQHAIDVFKPTTIHSYHLSVLKETGLFKYTLPNEEKWLKIGKDGISAVSSYSYTEDELNYMLNYGKTILNIYNFIIFNRDKYSNFDLSYGNLSKITDELLNNGTIIKKEEDVESILVSELINV